jgi:hypothetical protein
MDSEGLTSQIEQRDQNRWRATMASAPDRLIARYLVDDRGLHGQCHDLPKPGLVSCVPIPYRVAATELTVNRWAYRHDGVACNGHHEDRYRGFYTTLSEPLRGRSIRPAG